MKRTAVMIFILFLLPLASAVEWDMKTEFQQGEMLLAKLSGNFIKPILKENIYLYRGHTRVSINPSVARINDDYYVAIPLLGKTTNNYTLTIKEVEYMTGGESSTDDLEKNFTITNETAQFSVDKGFVTTSEDFEIQVQNLVSYLIPININAKTISGSSSGGFLSSLFEGETITDTSEKTFNLKSGEIKKIKFEIDDFTEPALKTISFSSGNLSYNIPVYVYVNKSRQNLEKYDLKFQPSFAEFSVATGEEKTRFVILNNTGEETLKNITLEVSEELQDYVKLYTKEIDELDSGSTIKIEFDIFSEDELNATGNIKAESDMNQTILTYCDLILNFIKDYVPPEGTDDDSDDSSTNSTSLLKDDEESSIGTYIGWGLLVLIVAGLIWFYLKKYKKVGTGKIDLLKGKK